MESTPDTSGYMIAGFVVSFITMGIYVVSLYIRNLNLKRDVETLESLQIENTGSKK
jgi:cell division protein FtsL